MGFAAHDKRSRLLTLTLGSDSLGLLHQRGLPKWRRFGAFFLVSMFPFSNLDAATGAVASPRSLSSRSRFRGESRVILSHSLDRSLDKAWIRVCGEFDLHALTLPVDAGEHLTVRRSERFGLGFF